MGIHKTPMRADGPKLKTLVNSGATVSSAAIHSSPYPLAATRTVWPMKNSANGSRHTGRCHRSHTARGSMSGRGTRTVRARNRAVAGPLPRAAQTAVTATKIMMLPVWMSNHSG